MPSCDIVIPVWNQLKATKECMESVKEFTEFPLRLIVVDNGSNGATVRYLESLKAQFPDVILLRNDVNEGFVKAVNQGIAASDADYICVLNNDTLLTRGWLDEMVRVAEENPKIGIVNPSSNNLGQKPARGQGIREYSEGLRVHRGRYVDLGTALGFCMLIKRAVIEKIGVFDEVFSPGNFEDTDFCLRAKKAGFMCARSLASYVYHRGNVSFNVMPGYRKDFDRNKKIFEERWGRQKRILFVLSRRDMSRKDILQKMEEEVNKGNWVYIAYREKNFDFNGHSHVILYDYRNHFALRTLLKLTFKKKKFDKIYCARGSLLKLINLLSRFHKAQVSEI